MRTILLGEPGSGKTTEILQAVRARLQAGDSAFRLLAPTATMAEHLRNQLAREGLLVRPRTIATLARFVRELAPGATAAGEAETRMILRALLDRERPSSLDGLWESATLCDAFVRAMEELANAGCNSLQWQALAGFGVSPGPVFHDFGRLYQGLEEELQRRGLLLRSAQMIAAAQAAPARLAELGIDTVWLDGFFSLTRAERELVAALAARASVTVALPEWPGVRPSLDFLEQRGFALSRRSPLRPQPRQTVVPCADADSLCSETARRIRQLAASGVPWREIGVIVRSAEPWAPRLETAFARHGIPARSYFATPLTGHPVCRLLSNAVAALLSGFDHAATLAALVHPAALAGESASRDTFEYAVREALPGQGLERLRRLAASQPDPEPLQTTLDILERTAALSLEPALPTEWPARLAPLASLVAAPSLSPAPDAAALGVWRARAAALRGFHSALQEAAGLLPPEPLGLAAFWEFVQDTLDAVALRLPPLQRDAVALLDVQEARQWELPYVFLCGLIEGEFPRAPQPDPILDEETRARLAAHGFFLTTMRDRERQESFLFRVALSRATRETVLLYPRRDAKGDELLPSFELAHLAAGEEAARPAPLDAGAPPPRRSYAQRIQEPALLATLKESHLRYRPTAIESFLACPFQFFASHTLELETPPPDPAERLGLREAGILLHKVIERWHREAGPILTIFEEEWTAFLHESNIREGFRTAAYRLQLERSLAAYEQEPRLQAGWRVATEEKVSLEIKPGENGDPIVIEGRIDRCDTSPGGECQVFDLKYTNARGLKSRVKQQQDDRAVQGGLYTLALEARGLRPVAFHLAALREGAEFHTWEGQNLEDLKTQARELTVQAATAIRKGEIEPRPASSEVCDWCTYRDACRIHEAAAHEEAAASS